MHETALVRDVVRRIEDLARATGAYRVTGARIWLGALSHLSAEHFREHFAIAAQESIAAGATLAIEVSDDLDDPHAQNVRLESVDLDECKPKGGWISSGCVSEERWLVKRHVRPPHCN